MHSSRFFKFSMMLWRAYNIDVQVPSQHIIVFNNVIQHRSYSTKQNNLKSSASAVFDISETIYCEKHTTWQDKRDMATTTIQYLYSTLTRRNTQRSSSNEIVSLIAFQQEFHSDWRLGWNYVEFEPQTWWRLGWWWWWRWYDYRT